MKCRSRVPGQGACLLSMSRTITIQGILILATISTEKHTLVFYLTWRDKILTKSMEHEMKVKVPGCELAE